MSIDVRPLSKAKYLSDFDRHRLVGGSLFIKES
jgi:hypothetical protein